MQMFVLNLPMFKDNYFLLNYSKVTQTYNVFNKYID